MADDDDRPYSLYSSGDDKPKRRRAEPGSGAPPGGDEDRPYTVYRSRKPGLISRLRGRGDEEPEALGSIRDERAERRRPGRTRKPISGGRIAKYVGLAIVAWLALSVVLFVISAQFEQDKVSSSAENTLDSAGPILTSANTILVLGSDARTKKTNDTGSAIQNNAPSRADTIMLMRVGPGKAARLSIPRDTVVNIPGSGQNKINAAYAIGGPALAITTVKQFLGIKVNHVLEVNFDNFPQLIDSMGGINVKSGCVKDKISGGDANGGVTIDLPAGTNHLDGRHALAFARVRKNACAPGEDDIDRAKRQQQMLSAMKSKVLSPFSFVRLPWISWNAPKAIRSDMSGPSLISLFAVMSTTGSPAPSVLKPTGFVTLPDGGSALTVSDDDKRAAVAKFLKG
jgi:LCP family protein required for cell wall assembly